jgi:hypothetical protein
VDIKTSTAPGPDLADGRTSLGWVPDACTLPTADQPLRLAEVDQLFATCLQQAQRLSAQALRLTLAGAVDLESRVRDLADRESACCTFFTFTVAAPQPGLVTLDVEVAATYVDVLDALADRAVQARAAHEGFDPAPVADDAGL